MHDKSKYWASLPIDQIAPQILGQYESYKQWLRDTGYAERIAACYRAFYGLDQAGTLAVTRNQEGVAQASINHFKSLVRRLHILVTENKLSFQPRSKNSDAKSQITSDLARGICEYYGDEKNLHAVLSEAVLGALIQLEYWISAPWDLAEGYELTVDGGRVIRSGDQKFETYGPYDVAHSKTDPKTPWVIIRKKVNKYVEAALHPDFADEILKTSISPDLYDMNYRREGLTGREDEDYAYKYVLMHSRTPVLLKGRLVEIMGNQVLVDKELGYTKVPCFKITAGDVLQEVWGDSPAVDLLPLQQALDALFSAVVTNNLNNSLQLIWSADPNLATSRLADGQILVTSATPPQPLNLTGSSNEAFKLIEMLSSHQGLLSGVNDVARGNPSSSLKSGTSLAVILAQAIQYVSNLQKSYARIAADVGSQLIDNIKQFATEDMTAYIVGSSRRGMVKKFKAKDLLDIERIAVDLANPLTQSYAGRMDLLSGWMQYGVIKDPKQVISFLRTGEIDAVTEDRFSDALLIREENEMIRKGEVPPVLLTDNHAEHVVDHKAIMSSPEAREDPLVFEAFMTHVQAHIRELRLVPPDLAAIISGQPLPAPLGAAPPAPPMPTIDGARMPSLPAEAPAQTQQAYQQALASLPQQQEEEF